MASVPAALATFVNAILHSGNFANNKNIQTHLLHYKFAQITFTISIISCANALKRLRQYVYK